jgi:hypothetical protein
MGSFRSLRLMLEKYAEPSPLMRSVPHEIIDKIIDELSFHKDTLKQCSTVSRSFCVSSRRHLFYLIEFNTIKTVILFHRLVIRTPDIARNVRRVQVGFHDYPSHGTADRELGEGGNVAKRLATNTLLAEVFASMTCVETFAWRISAVWDELSCDLQSVLVKLFQRNPTIINIENIDGFPLSALHIVSPVKQLGLSFVVLSSDHEQVILPHLKMLRINNVRQLEGVRLLVPNLQHISFLEGNVEVHNTLVQEAVSASGTSLQRLWWNYRLGQGT